MVSPIWFRDKPWNLECHGNGEEHCCWVDGEVCRYLEVDTVPGRHWVCGVRRRYDTWEEAHQDPGYIENVHSVWERTGTADCGDWKIEGQCCFSEDNPPIYNQE